MNCGHMIGGGLCQTCGPRRVINNMTPAKPNLPAAAQTKLNAFIAECESEAAQHEHEAATLRKLIEHLKGTK